MAKILIVDDDPDILFLLRRYLEQAGYTVVAVSDPSKAVALAAQEAVDAAILDIMMPGISGYEVLRGLRHQRLTQTVPVMFLSARGEGEEKARGLELGADDFLAKPFDSSDLLDRLARLLERRRSEGLAQEGDLAVYPGRELLTCAQQDEQSGELVVVGEVGTVQMSLHRGAVTAARSGLRDGADAVLTALGMARGRFHFREEEASAAAGPTEDRSAQGLLLDRLLLRQTWLEEQRRELAPWLPPSQSPLRLLGEIQSGVGIPSELPLSTVQQFLQSQPGATMEEVIAALPQAPSRLELGLAWLTREGLLEAASPRDRRPEVAAP